VQVVDQVSESYAYDRVVDSICALNWTALSREDLTDVATAYYYFSIQFRENLEIACKMYPEDDKLQELQHGECNTDNLSPWPDVAAPGEKLDHDEFMRRLLALSPTHTPRRSSIDRAGQQYLKTIRQLDGDTRARSIASYEDGGLEKLFRSILTAPDWDSELLQAFRYFLVQHIRFDEDPESGHGALSRHLAPDDRILPLWLECKRILVEAAPVLLS
jgi:hypothetical protein